MSVQSEQAAVKFREWKKDIENRCEEFVFQQQRTRISALTSVSSAAVSSGLVNRSGQTIRVLPDVDCKDGWNVFKGSHIAGHFIGPVARQNALRLAQRIAEAM